MNESAFDALPPLGVTVTLTAPGERLAGTVQVTEVAVQLLVDAGVLPKRTVPLLPRLLPAMTTVLPVRPWFGVRLVSVGPACPPVTRTSST